MHKKYAENACRKMPRYFQDVLTHIIPQIDGGDVCDLGAHAMGHYWAIGYIERVNSYSCYDLSAEALDIFRDTIKNLKPGDIRRNQGDLLDFLYEQDIIKASVDEIERQLVEKLSTVKQFDFLKDTPDRQYDVVLAMESLPVVDTFDDFLTALRTAYGFLREGGLLLTVSGQYEKVTPYITEMQSHKIEGKLNPGAATFAEAMKIVGFRDIKTKTVPVDFQDYLGVDFCSARR